MKTKRKDETAQVCFPKLYISLPSFFFFLRSFTNYLFEKERRIETLESHHRPSPIFLYIPFFFFIYLKKNKKERKIFDSFGVYMLTSPGKSERKRLWAGHLLLFLFCIHPTSFSIHLSPLKGAIGALLLLCLQLLKLDGCFFVYSIPFHSFLYLS